MLTGAVRHGGMVLLTGPAGIGKSRLVAEAGELAAREGLMIATGRATPALGSLPYAPIRNALLQVVRDRPLQPDDALRTWRAPLAAVLPEQAALPGYLAGAELIETRPELVGEATLQLLERLPRRTVIVLEDLHWADPDTVAMLDYLADAATGLTTWLLTSRDPAQVVERMRERRAVQLLGVAPLASVAIGEMVRACRPSEGGAALAELVRRAQRLSDGVPLYVEELVASPGVPASFAEAVRDRLSGLPNAYREVLTAAAVLGREIPADLLAATLEEPTDAVDGALRAGMAATLIEPSCGDLRFRHALTREALLESLLPAQRRALARRALPVVIETKPEGWEGLAAELALTAGEPERAGELLALAGSAALDRGALVTAVELLRRAVDLNRTDPRADLALIAALCAAGDIDAALQHGDALLTAGVSAEVPLRLLLAEAAARGDRWATAAQHLEAIDVSPADAPQATVLAAEIAFATDDIDGARDQVGALVHRVSVPPDVLSRAYVLLGRVERLGDLPAAQRSFERALAVAAGAGLPLRALDALHELGTIELLEHAGTERLLQARGNAERVGAMGTRAVIDLQLTAAYLSRFETDAAEHHAECARELAEQLRLRAVATKALCGLAETYVQRRQPEQMERLLALALARDPDDAFIEPFAWGQCRGLLAIFENDWSTALGYLERAMAALERVPHPEPVEFRALWPLLLASACDERAAGALVAAERSNVTIASANRGFLGYARAILAGRAGDRAHAAELALRADAHLVRFPVWADLARLCAAPAAAADGWGTPERWLTAAARTFASAGLDALAQRCRGEEAPLAVTEREAEVLALLRTGLTNKEIAARLHLSPRTVEKHVESMLRKTGSRSRTQLALWGPG
jgi:DNA-binding CsgD family transcriptional regulator/tetratricopeptide (TPR) repeat protein